MSESNIIPIKVGQLIPLLLQLIEPEDDVTYYAKAEIKDETGAVLETITMSDIGNGLFTDRSYQMPDLNYVIAFYSIWLDDVFTEESDFSETHDMITRDDGPLKINSEITATIIAQDELTATVSQSSQASALVESEKTVMANITKLDEVSAGVTSNEITGDVE